MSTRILNLDDALYSYLREVSVREPPLLARLRRETARHPRGRMQISPEQGLLQACMNRNNTLLHLENRQCLSFATSWIPFLVSW